MKRKKPRTQTTAARRGSQPRARYKLMPWMNQEPDRTHISDTVADGLTRLTLCEKSCLYWVSLGKTSSEIAQLIERSENTVNFHLGSACRKLAVGSRHAVIRYLLLARLLPA